MDELFNIISASARIDKTKRRKKASSDSTLPPKDDTETIEQNEKAAGTTPSRDRTGKRDTSKEKLEQVHKEKIAAFRRSMDIRIANKHDVVDPITSFDEISKPLWWRASNNDGTFLAIRRAICRNIESGKWKEPTPIQMQSIPTLLNRQDIIGAAPTGSGKSGAFLIPTLFLAGALHQEYYGESASLKSNESKAIKDQKAQSKDCHRAGEIRSLVLAPSLELASQLYREAERLGMGKPGGISVILLSKSNVADVTANRAGGKRGVDVLVATPLRLVDSIQKGLRLNKVRMVILDEADRLLDTKDGKREPDAESTESNSFLTQMDRILSEIPPTAVRGLFSATVTPMVRSLSESILRNPLDLSVGGHIQQGGANSDIDQVLTFVSREEGKLLAIRQIVQRGELRPPVIVFLQSQERAQALFAELLYDGIRVDVIHAGRSRSARELAVTKFRKGDTWVLICTDLVARGVDFRAVNMVINYDLPDSAITYVHRIGRTGRAGRKGKAITLFTEGDFEHLRPIANVVKQSGCHVPEWMLTLRKGRRKQGGIPPKRKSIDTTPNYDKRKQSHKKQMIRQSKNGSS